jgi:hypothetical protein
MSKNQLHGKKLEDMIKSAFPGSSDHGRSAQSHWDIEAVYDKELHLPTSIKTTGSSVVCLADARKFWSINEAYRLLVAQYEQRNAVKQFQTLYEFLISSDEHRYMLGAVTAEEIGIFHDTLRSFKKGFHEEARAYHREMKASLPRSIVQLDPKVDSKTQRRLQCSVTLEALMQNVGKHNLFREGDFYRDICVSLSIKSSRRQFSKSGDPFKLDDGSDVFYELLKR